MSYLTEYSIYIREINSNTTINIVDDLIKADASSGNLEITLPRALGNTGKEFLIKKIDSTFNTVTILTSNNDTIDGQSSFEIGSQWESFSFISDGISAYLVF